MLRRSIPAFQFIFSFIINGVSCSVTYNVLSTKTDFATAKQRCLDAGMELATIKDNAANTEAASYINGGGVPGEMWVGMYWDGDIQNFRWSDNDAEVVEDINWDPVEPNCMTPFPDPCYYGSPNQNCVRLTTSYVFKTIYCDSLYYPLCKSVSEPTTSDSEQSTKSLPCTTCEACKPCATCEPCNTYKPETPTIQSLTCEPCEPCGKGTSYLPIETTVVPPCDCNKQNALVTSNTSSNIVLYKVEKKKTGSYHRQLTSAIDDRFSAKVLGYTGVIILVTFATLFVLVDVINFWKLKDEKNNIS